MNKIITTPFQPIAKALKSLSKHLPTRKNRAIKAALKLRRDTMLQLWKLPNRPDWTVTVPTRLNAPAFVVTPQGCIRVHQRNLHARNKRFCFSLSCASGRVEKGHALICRDPDAGQAYVVLAHRDDSLPPYISLSLDEARALAVAVLPLAS